MIAAATAFADAKRLTPPPAAPPGSTFRAAPSVRCSTQKQRGLAITAQATGASGENMRLVEAGDVDFAIVQNDVADSAFNGKALSCTK